LSWSLCYPLIYMSPNHSQPHFFHVILHLPLLSCVLPKIVSNGLPCFTFISSSFIGKSWLVRSFSFLKNSVSVTQEFFTLFCSEGLMLNLLILGSLCLCF
jgi:hypothetical protein